MNILDDSQILIAEGISFFNCRVNDGPKEFFGISLHYGGYQIRIACDPEVFAKYLEGIAEGIRSGRRPTNADEIGKAFAKGCGEFYDTAASAKFVDLEKEKMN